MVLRYNTVLMHDEDAAASRANTDNARSIETLLERHLPGLRAFLSKQVGAFMWHSPGYLLTTLRPSIQAQLGDRTEDS